MRSQIGPSDDGMDEKHNNLIAAGALLTVLQNAHTAGLTAVNLILDEDFNATNQIEVEFSFLKSAYRITVERVP